jgi:hypothetical protein
MRSRRDGPFRGRRSLALALGLALGLPASALIAQEPFRMTPALAGQLSHVECRLLGGRIWLTSKHIGGQISSTFRGNGQVQESLAVDLSSAWPRLEYQALSQEFAIHASVSAGEQVSIRREPATGTPGPRVIFKQVPDGGVELEWQDGDERAVCRGPTLWHILLTKPQFCRRELAPLLKLVHPDWDLATEADAVEQAVLNAARQTRNDRSARWNELLDELASDAFSRRRAADRALRAAGLAVVPFLRGLDDARLEPEQRMRVRRIVASLTRFDDEDTPDRVALWLVGDPAIWLALAARDDEHLRRTAAAELEEILGRPINFDPTADADKRGEQLARLTNEIASLQPAAAN